MNPNIRMMQNHLLFCPEGVLKDAGSKVSLSLSAESPDDPMITAAFTERPRVYVCVGVCVCVCVCMCVKVCVLCARIRHESE
jgi:hypothetical protein